MTALELIRGWLALGWPVFPVREDKAPRIRDWERAATTDEATVAEWLRRWPDTGFGVALGRAGLVVVDTDVNKRLRDGTPVSGEDSLRALEAEAGASLPPTFTVETPSGGRHYYFRAAGLGSRNALRPALDVKSGGGYVVLPGSRFPRGTYRVVSGDVKIAPLPQWFRDGYGRPYRVRSRASGAPPEIVPDTEAKLARAAELIENWPYAEEGERNTSLYQLARELCRIGISRDRAMDLIAEGGTPADTLPPAEAARTVASAYADLSDFGCNGEEHDARIFAQMAAAAQDDLGFGGDGEGPAWNPVGGSFASFIGREPPPVSWLVAGLMPYALQPIMVCGAPGTAKSLLGAQLCREVSLGRNFLGRATRQCRSLYVTFEDSRDDLFRRAAAATSRINPDRDLDNEANWLYLGGEPDFAFMARSRATGRIVEGPGFRKLADYVMAMRVHLVVLDHLSRFFTDNENDRAAVNAFGGILTRFCEEAHCMVVMLAHTNKGGMEYSGASANAGIYRQVFLLSRDAAGVYSLKCLKSNSTATGEAVDFAFDDWYCQPLTDDEAAEVRAADSAARSQAKDADRAERQAAADEALARMRSAMEPGERYTADDLMVLAGFEGSRMAFCKVLAQYAKHTGEIVQKRSGSDRYYSLSD